MVTKSPELTDPARESVEDKPDDPTHPLAGYDEYNRILRTWFVAFGAGGPALLITNEKLAAAIAKAGDLRCIVALFLVGTAAQVFGAMLNKYANYEVYLCTNKPTLRNSKRQKLANWIIERIEVDIVIDVVTVAVFGMATWRMFNVVAGAGV